MSTAIRGSKAQASRAGNLGELMRLGLGTISCWICNMNLSVGEVRFMGREWILRLAGLPPLACLRCPFAGSLPRGPFGLHS